MESKGNELLPLQLEKLKKQRTLEGNQSLILKSMGQLLSELKMQVNLLQNTKKSNIEMENQDKFLHPVQSKGSVIVSKENEQKEHEEEGLVRLCQSE